jgi:hypothetical protein
MGRGVGRVSYYKKSEWICRDLVADLIRKEGLDLDDFKYMMQNVNTY